MLKNLIFVLLALVVSTTSCAEDTQTATQTATETSATIDPLITAAPEGANVYIISPADGDVVSGTFTVKFGLSGMGVAPAGIDMENTGHHHILIDVDEMPDMSMPLPTTENVVHFGMGQTETTLTLSEGTHTLQLLLGNYLHVPHNQPVLSKKITVTVK